MNGKYTGINAANYTLYIQLCFAGTYEISVCAEQSFGKLRERIILKCKRGF